MRTRDYCTTPRHVLAMCLNVIRCAVEMGNFLHVANYVGKAEATPEVTVRWGPQQLPLLFTAAVTSVLSAGKNETRAPLRPQTTMP